MDFSKILPLILTFSLFFLGCESKKTYDIDSDKAIADMNTRIQSLQEDLNSLVTELDQVQAVLKDRDIDADLRKSIKKEIHEGEKYKKEIDQWIAYLKIQRMQRYNSLVARKGSEKLLEEAEAEVKAYFVQKELKPIKAGWKERYRTAIEL